MKLSRWAIGLGSWLLVAGTANGEFVPEEGRVLALESAPSPHWVWVTDISYPNFIPGRAMLVDADSGRHLGMITMGFGLTPLGLPRHGKFVYTVETHYDRTSRGKRTDVVAIYDARTLNVLDEIEIPPKKVSAVTMLTFAGLTDDDRFMLVYNFTPAQSVTVVDLERRRVASELDTAGCGLVMPAGPRRFAMLCGDGSLMKVRLSDKGEDAGRSMLDGLFEPKREFLTEKAVRHGNAWIFVTNHGEIRIVDLGGDTVAVRATWPLFDAAEREAGWRIGGQQHLAVHEATGLLYALVHQGGPDSHKDPGADVFVYDVGTGKRVRSIALSQPAASIQVTQDGAPLLLATNAYPPTLEVYEASSGKMLRAIEEVAVTPMLLQTPVAAGAGN